MAALLRKPEDVLGDLFDIVDVDKSKILEDKEVFGLLKLVKPKTTWDEFCQYFSSMDKDMSNGLDRKEFASYFMKQFDSDDKVTFDKRIKETIKFATRKPKLMEVFEAFDTDGNGTLDRGELYQMCKLCKPKWKNEQLTQLLKAMDADGNNKVDKREFAEYYFRMLENDNDDEFAEHVDMMFHGRRRHKLKAVFTAWDFDANGELSVNEFCAMLRMNGRKFVSADDVLDTVVKFDVDKDRKISFAEWVRHMSGMISMMDDSQFNKAVSNMINASTSKGDLKQ